MQQFQTPEAGLAAESRLLADCAADGRSRLLIWQAEGRAIVAPAALSRRDGFAIAAHRSAERGWPVLLRPTGGGAVPQGAGVINLAMTWRAPAGTTLDSAYRRICAPISAALSAAGIATTTGATAGSFCDGAFNLNASDRKIVGTAQRWKAGPAGPTVLAHALVLFDLALDAAVEAVKGLYDDMALDPVIRRGPHVTVAELAPQADRIDFVGSLARECQTFTT